MVKKRSYEFVDLSFQEERELELEERKNRLEAIKYKICSRCGERKPVSKFTADKRNTDGRVSICKLCRSKESLNYYYQNKDQILKRYKEYQKINKKDRSVYFKDYRKDHKEHLRVMAQKWYKENKKAIKKRNLKYYQEHREACQAIRELWRESHKEEIKKYNREYVKINK